MREMTQEKIKNKNKWIKLKPTFIHLLIQTVKQKENWLSRYERIHSLVDSYREASSPEAGLNSQSS